tara:strand:+ start:1457 stop:1615 length:159 start_codon:yes stop_codon:yes gene_type:complete
MAIFYCGVAIAIIALLPKENPLHLFVRRKAIAIAIATLTADALDIVNLYVYV